MKIVDACPKCNSHDIIRFDGETNQEVGDNALITGRTILSAVPISRYVCCTCGFTEEWIDEKYLEKVKMSKKAK